MLKLKVYGITTFLRGVNARRCSGDNQVRAVCATTSQRRFAELIGASLHTVQHFGSVTHNQTELDLCLGNKPETVRWTAKAYSSKLRDYKPWRRA